MPHAIRRYHRDATLGVTPAMLAFTAAATLIAACACAELVLYLL